MDKIFVGGLIYKDPNDTAPKWLKGKLSVKVDEFKKFLDEHNNNGWINIDLKVSQGGKAYAELNTWRPDKEKQKEPEEEAIDIDKIPL